MIVDRRASTGQADGIERVAGPDTVALSRLATRRRLALGLSPTPPALIGLLVFGVLLGPHGLGLLSDRILKSLDPAIAFALAALGALIGLDVKVRGPREGSLLAAASLEAAVTLVTVTAAVAITHALSDPSPGARWLLAVMVGICAASSSSMSGTDENGRGGAARICDLDDLLPVLLIGIATAAARDLSPRGVMLLVLQVTVISLTIAAAGWLLISSTSSASERRVFSVGALLLLGGSAAYLSTSALLAGLAAGVFWTALGPVFIEYIARDLRYLQHPLVVLLLLVAGARLDVSTSVIGLALVYVVFRTAGKLLGGWSARLVVGGVPRGLGFQLISPGVVGIACAVDALHAAAFHEWSGALITTVVAGSLVSEGLARHFWKAAA